MARKWFGFSREWAAPLASGISICGVSAAIATAGAIRARPMVAVMVSSLVVVFAMVELLILPFAARAFLADEPLVAAAWMGLAVKTDGAAVASGAITEALIYADAAARGIKYDKGWMVGTTTTIKIFIDIFIGVWAFLLAYIWTRHIEPRKPGDKLRAAEIWERFPKFVLGFVRTFLVVLLIGLASSPASLQDRQRRHGPGQRLPPAVFRADLLLHRLDVGLARALAGRHRQARRGLCRLAVWLRDLGRAAISWIFFSGLKPPIAG